MSGLKKIEYVNFGDCLVRSKGAVAIAHSLSHFENLKEVILSYNEINLTSGLEIAEIMLKRKDTLKLLDLNGNKFGEEGKMDVKTILQPFGEVFGTLR